MDLLLKLDFLDCISSSSQLSVTKYPNQPTLFFDTVLFWVWKWYYAHGGSHYSPATNYICLTGCCVHWNVHWNILFVPIFGPSKLYLAVTYTFTVHIVFVHVHWYTPQDHCNFLPAGRPRRLKTHQPWPLYKPLNCRRRLWGLTAMPCWGHSSI